MIGYPWNFYRHSACWALFLVVANVITPSARGQQAPLFDVATMEVPLFDVATMERNETFRTNFCEVHRRVENGEILLRNALKDMNIRPVLFRYQLNKETGAIAEVNPPIGIKILDEVARRAQFKWRDSYGVVDSPNKNQTWGEVLSWSLDTYDLNGDWYLRTTERLADGIIFPEKWYDGSLIMIRKTVILDGVFQWKAFLMPFTFVVWILIVATAIISGLIYYAIDYIDCDGDRNKMEVRKRDVLFLMLLNFTGEYAFDPKKTGNRLIALSTCFLFLIVLATYTANLASFLVIRNTPQLVINDIQDVIKNDLRVCVLRDAAAEVFMRDNHDTAKIVEKETIEDTYLALDNDDCDVTLSTISTWETKKGDAVYNGDCRKEWAGRVVQPNDAGYSLRDSAELCSSLLRDIFSLHLLEMKRDKTYNTIWDTHRAQSVTNNCQGTVVIEDDNSDMVKLGVKNLGGIFICHAIVLVVAFAVTIYSAFLRKCKVKRAGATATNNSPLPASSSSSKSAGATATNKSPLPASRSSSKSAGATATNKSPSPASRSSSKSAGATVVQSRLPVPSSTLKTAPNSVTDSAGLSNSQEMEYITAKKQMDCMMSMQKQIDSMQEQLAKMDVMPEQLVKMDIMHELLKKIVEGKTE